MTKSAERMAYEEAYADYLEMEREYAANPSEISYWRLERANALLTNAQLALWGIPGST